MVSKHIQRRVAIFLVCILFLCLFQPMFAFAAETQPPTAPKPFPAEQMQAQAAYLINADNGEVLYANNENAPLVPASLAKVMTLLIVEEQLKAGKIKLSDKVTISKESWLTPGSRMFLEIGQVYTVEELIKGLAVVSGNDAAISLAEHVAGSPEKFVEMMNQRAKELGMANTTFQTVNGLPLKGKSDSTTAKDLGILAKYYINHFPNMLKIHSMKEYTTKTRTGPIKQPNNNSLLGKYKGMDGLKTGFADYYNFIGTAKQGKNRLIVVTLGSSTANKRMYTAESLLNYGFAQYKTYTAGKKGDAIDTLPVYEANGVNEVDVQLNEDVVYGINVRDESRVKIKNNVPDHLLGGLKKGEKIGTQVVTLDGKKIAEGEIVVKEDLPEANWFISIFHRIALFFHELLNKLV